MKCMECGETEFNFNEQLGETECASCGLVICTEPFEQTVRMVSDGQLDHSADKGALGSVITGKGSYKFNKRWVKKDGTPAHVKQALVMCKMTLSAIQSESPLKDRVEEVYLELYKKNIFGKTGLENRASAVVWYVLKENRTPFPLKEITKEYDCNPKSVRKLCKKIAKFYAHSLVANKADEQFLLSQAVSKITEDPVFLKNCTLVMERVEEVLKDAPYNKTPSYYVTIAWITKNVTVNGLISILTIAENTGIHRATIYKNTKEIIGYLGYEKVADLKGLPIEKIGSEING